MDAKFQKLVLVTFFMGASQLFLSYFAFSMGQLVLSRALSDAFVYLTPGFFLVGSLVLAFMPSNNRVNTDKGNAPKAK